MDDFLFEVVSGEVEIVKSPLQAKPLEDGAKVDELFDYVVTQQTVPPLRSEIVQSTNRAFPS